MNVDSIEGMKEQCMSRRKYSTYSFLRIHYTCA